jgi:hypothetical protein
MFPARHEVAQKMEKQDLAKALEKKIPAWPQEYGGKLNAILRGSDAAFRQAKNWFLDQLEDHLKTSIIKLYTPEQITRRNKVVECQLSQNMADLNRQKGLEGFIRFMVLQCAPQQTQIYIVSLELRGSTTHIRCSA